MSLPKRVSRVYWHRVERDTTKTSEVTSQCPDVSWVIRELRWTSRNILEDGMRDRHSRVYRGLRGVITEKLVTSLRTSLRRKALIILNSRRQYTTSAPATN